MRYNPILQGNGGYIKNIKRKNTYDIAPYFIYLLIFSKIYNSKKTEVEFIFIPPEIRVIVIRLFIIIICIIYYIIQYK